MSIPQPGASGSFFWDGSQWVSYICSRADVVDVNSEFIDTSVTGNGQWSTRVPSGLSWSARIDGLVNLSKTTNPITISQLREFQNNGTRIYFKFELLDDDGNFHQEVGYGYIQTCNITSSFDNVPTFSVTIVGDGQLTTIIGS